MKRQRNKSIRKKLLHPKPWPKVNAKEKVKVNIVTNEKKDHDSGNEPDKTVDLSVNKIVPLAKCANVKAEILESKFGKNLRRLGHSIPSSTLKLIEVYGTIKNVNPDGNCGYYSTMVGLNHMCIDVTENVTELRRDIYNYVLNNRQHLFTDMSFRGKRKLKDGSVVGKSRDDFINEQVLTRI